MSIHVSCRYALLVCYLPPLPLHPFAVKQTPLSRLQLDRRLALLQPEDAQDLATIEEVVHWDRIPLQITEHGFVRRAYNAMAKLRTPALQDMLRWRLELRTLVAALRRRCRGLPAPGADEIWGYGRCVDTIRRYWDRDDFNIGHRYPWVAMADQYLRQGQHKALEHLLLSRVWDHYARLAWDHHFDFEAVVLYVLRWNLIDRLTRYDPAAATLRFSDLLTQGLGPHANLSSSPAPVGEVKHFSP